MIISDLNAVSISTIATVFTPGASKTLRFMGGWISVSAVMSVLFEDNSAGAGQFVFRTPKLAIDTPYQFFIPDGFRLSVAANLLKATGSAAGAITGSLFGRIE